MSEDWDGSFPRDISQWQGHHAFHFIRLRFKWDPYLLSYSRYYHQQIEKAYGLPLPSWHQLLQLFNQFMDGGVYGPDPLLPWQAGVAHTEQAKLWQAFELDEESIDYLNRLSKGERLRQKVLAMLNQAEISSESIARVDVDSSNQRSTDSELKRD